MSTPASARPTSPTRRNPRLSTLDGSWHCVVWGVGECNIAVFGVALGMSPTMAGLPDTARRLCGSVLQSASHRAVVALVGSLIGAALLTSHTLLDHPNGEPAAGSPEAPGVGGGIITGYAPAIGAEALLRLLPLMFPARVRRHISPPDPRPTAPDGEDSRNVADELPPLAGTFEQPVIPIRPPSGSQGSPPTHE